MTRGCLFVLGYLAGASATLISAASYLGRGWHAAFPYINFNFILILIVLLRPSLSVIGVRVCDSPCRYCVNLR